MVAGPAALAVAGGPGGSVGAVVAGGVVGGDPLVGEQLPGVRAGGDGEAVVVEAVPHIGLRTGGAAGVGEQRADLAAGGILEYQGGVAGGRHGVLDREEAGGALALGLGGEAHDHAGGLVRAAALPADGPQGILIQHEHPPHTDLRGALVLPGLPAVHGVQEHAGGRGIQAVTGEAAGPGLGGAEGLDALELVDHAGRVLALPGAAAVRAAHDHGLLGRAPVLRVVAGDAADEVESLAVGGNRGGLDREVVARALPGDRELLEGRAGVGGVQQPVEVADEVELGEGDGDKEGGTPARGGEGGGLINRLARLAAIGGARYRAAGATGGGEEEAAVLIGKPDLHNVHLLGQESAAPGLAAIGGFEQVGGALVVVPQTIADGGGHQLQGMSVLDLGLVEPGVGPGLAAVGGVGNGRDVLADAEHGLAAAAADDADLGVGEGDSGDVAHAGRKDEIPGSPNGEGVGGHTEEGEGEEEASHGEEFRGGGGGILRGEHRSGDRCHGVRRIVLRRGNFIV